jgi:hypothetical protein
VKERPYNPIESGLQLLMQPARPLLPDSVYELRASNGQEDKFYIFQNGFFGPQKRKATVYRWRVAATADTVPPRWTNTPTVLRREYSENSEGIDNYVAFSCPLQDASLYLVRVAIQSARYSKPVISYLIPWQKQLGVGWFTCGGNFLFGPNEPCTIAFEALDAAGNRSSASGWQLPFRGPAQPVAAPGAGPPKVKPFAPRR